MPRQEMLLLREIRTARESLGLSLPESEVINKKVRGCTNKRIAVDLATSEETVERHIASVLGNVGASNRMELVLFALFYQLVDRPEPRRPQGGAYVCH